VNRTGEEVDLRLRVDLRTTGAEGVVVLDLRDPSGAELPEVSPGTSTCSCPGFVAGGMGITPVLPMITAAERAGAAWELHHGGRSRRSMAFLEALEEATGTTVVLHPQDEVGLIDLDRILGEPRPGTLVHSCGPEPLPAAVDHRDSLLTPDEQAASDTMFPCVSRAACPKLVVLDL
jgi:ferredoxin-NADP reductase